MIGLAPGGVAILFFWAAGVGAARIAITGGGSAKEGSTLADDCVSTVGMLTLIILAATAVQRPRGEFAASWSP